MDARINGKTRLLGVIGTPIQHTGSPVLYNYCFNYYGINAVYLAFECDESQVKDTLAAMRRLHMRGANVTMPCKNEVANNMDHLAGAAKYIHAVNTIVNDNGVLTGHITDGKGVVLDLKDHGISIVDKNIVLLGVGGAAKAIMVQCALDGAKSITTFNRSLEGLLKAEEIGKQMMHEGVSCTMEYYPLSNSTLLHDRIRNADILINATSVGMKPLSEGKSLVTDMSAFHEDLVIYDVIYNPLQTKLMSDALEHGVKKENVIGGKGMLMWQASEAFKLYSGLEMPTDAIKQFLKEKEKNSFEPLQDISENISY